MDNTRIFDEVWDTLAGEGKVDAKGGAEHTRVKAAWLKSGCQSTAKDFIEREAKKLPAPLHTDALETPPAGKPGKKG